MGNEKRISIAKDFSKFPAGRFASDGPFSGEHCRKRLLVPALKDFATVEVVLDGTLGYGSSFLEEAFGGLVRIERFTPKDLHDRMTLVSKEDDSFVAEIWSYIDDATPGEEDVR